ncbi:sulfotransferase [Candidatus Neomarinimicrobiota bacterium]
MSEAREPKEVHVRPIFIVGCERSGTTLLRLMLHSHPNIAIPPQTKFSRKLYKRRIYFGNLRKAGNRTRLARWFSNHFNANTKLIDLGLSRSEIEEAIYLAAPTFGSILGAIFRLYAQKWSKPRWGDKRPYYIKYLPVLYRLFPGAQVIHLIRDGRDCVASLKGMPWWREGEMGAILNWREAIRHGKRARGRYRSDQFIELRYEDLVTQAEEQLRRICSFLGETFDPRMLAFQDIASKTVPAYKIQWHARTQQALDSSAIGKWHKKLTPWEVALMQYAAGKELEEHGYLLSTGADSLSPSIRIKFLARVVLRGMSHAAYGLVDRFLSVCYPWPLAYEETQEGKSVPQESTGP